MHDKIFSSILSFILIFVIITSSLYLQVIEGAKLKLDSTTRFKTAFINADRGLIFDRNGTLLVQNRSTFSLYMHPGYIPDRKYLDKLMDDAGFADKELAFQTYTTKKFYDSILLKRNYDNSTFITKYLADETQYKGIEVVRESQRVYLDKDLTAHLIGYTGDTNDSDKTLGYRENTQIGRAGVEQSYDTLLRGVDGKISIDNKTQSSSVESQPINGKNLYLSIDINIQKELVTVLSDGISKYGANGGVGLLQNLDTGEILAYVSLPSYDPNMFVGGISESDYRKLNTDPHTPELDRISQTNFPPGSIFKIATASSLLESGSEDTNVTFTTGGIFKYGGTTFRDFSSIDQGTLNIVGGLCRSSNIFFMKSSLLMDDKLSGGAIGQIDKYAGILGLGKKTGIDVPEGYPGDISSPELKKELYGQDWLTGDLLNAAIGQGLTLVSPIQILGMVGTLANNGNAIKPRVVHSIGDSESVNQTSLTQKVYKDKVNFKQSTWDTIKQGLFCGTHMGIIQDLNSPYVSVSAKSGTAEFGAPDPKTGAYPDRHGWVGGFFPSDKPKYAFTLLLEKGGTSNNTVKLARTFIDWLYKDYKIDTQNE